jgi:two-component system response regulator NreC
VSFNIIIADDHEVIRAGLRALLGAESDLQVVGEAANGEEAVHLAEQLTPDIALLDISMPGLNGIEATRKIHEAFPSTRVLILTVHEEKELLQEALRNGASGYVLKQAVKSELINAIHAVARGDLYVHSAMTRALLDQTAPVSPPSIRKDYPTLTTREVEILRLIAQGYTNSQIGDQLYISVRTVEFHRSNLMGKLGLDSRVGLVRYAAEHGLV